MSFPFRVFSICVVKNEADVIQYCLKEACKWSERIYVYDNQSTDGTWEKVQAMASDQIVPWKQDDKVFQESIRSDVFNAFRHEPRDGDWWCRLDADEFQLRDPRPMLAQVRWPFHVVWGIAVEYYITRQDLATIDFSQPVEDVLPQLKHYRVANSEPRFFRHRKLLKWGSDNGAPTHMGLTWPERVSYRHYKYRSPDQMARRLRTRHEAIARGSIEWWSQLPKDVDKLIVDDDSCSVEQTPGDISFDSRLLPNHLESGLRKGVKWLLHSSGIWP